MKRRLENVQTMGFGRERRFLLFLSLSFPTFIFLFFRRSSLERRTPSFHPSPSSTALHSYLTVSQDPFTIALANQNALISR